jgi:glycosyltransferase involved in cell wall biosynthesis
VLPELDRRLGGDYALHIYGAGRLFPAVAKVLDHPRVVNRGFVDDIDAELRSAKVFLLANNNNPAFVTGHTRVLHAWSLGSCVVAQRNIARAMPEVVHGENALLAETGAELAEQAAAATADEELRRRIGEGGRRTYEREFRPEIVIGRVVDRITAG